MKRRVVDSCTVSAALLALIVVAAPAARAADQGPYLYGGHEYWVRFDPCFNGWQEAEDYAVFLGGHLVAINDSAENDFIQSIIGSSGGWYIGLTDTAVEGDWVWSNGDPTVYLNWAPPFEPNGGTSENCGQILGGSGHWNDLPCDHCLGAVIEIVPPPALGDGVITTVAGNFNGDGFLATDVPLWPTGGLIPEPDGNLLINGYGELYRLDMSTGTMTRVAGIRSVSSTGDGGPATLASWASFGSWARDSGGNVYFADSFFSKVRKISPDGTITTVAGTGVFGYSGDGGPATSAELGQDFGVAVDPSDTLYIADTSNHAIRMVDGAGIIATVVGNGTCGFGGDSGPAVNAVLCYPNDVTFDHLGVNMFIADSGNSVIRRVDAAGKITTEAGMPHVFSYCGDGGISVNACLNDPVGVVFDSAGNMFIADFQNYRVRRVQPDGLTTTVAGTGTFGFSGDGGPATSAQLSLVQGVAIDNSDRLLIADTNDNRRVRMVDDGMISTIAGTGNNFFGEGTSALTAAMSPRGMEFDASGNLVFADGSSNSRIRQIDANGIITTIAGTGVQGSAGDGGPALLAEFFNPTDVIVAPDGSMYVADRNNHKIRRIDSNGIVSTVAGNGTLGFSGDGGPATSAQLYFPTSVALWQGNLYIADDWNERIRKVDANGVITTVAGDGNAGFYGDGGPATSAALDSPNGVALDSDGMLYIADTNNDRVRKVDENGIITTFISTLSAPNRISTNADDTLLIATETNIWHSDLSANLTNIAGTGARGYSGDGGLATNAAVIPNDAVMDANGDIFISDAGNVRIRKVSTSTTPPPPETPLPSVSEQAVGLVTDSNTGAAVAGLGDIDGDGISDFIAGAPGFDDGTSPAEAGAGAVYLGSTDPGELATVDILFVGGGDHDRAGVSVEGEFDFNKDGVLDFMIGAEQVDRTDPMNPVPVGPGKVYLIYFDPNDVTHYPNLTNPALADRVDLSLVGQVGGVAGVVLTGQTTGDQAGFAVAGGGSTSPAGGPDIAIGAPGRDTPGGVDAGTAYLLFNEPSLSGTVALSRVANGQSDQVEGVVYEGAAAGDALGFSVAFPGDVVDPDGDDFAMGAPLSDPDDGTGAEIAIPDAGRTYVASGGILVTGITEVCQIGEPSAEEGTSFVVDGIQLLGEQAGEQSGYAISGGGDNLINGRDDFLIGAPFYDAVGASDEGRVLHSAGRLPLGITEVCQIGLAPAPAEITGPIDGFQWIGAAAGDQLGTAVAGVGDVTGDLTDDVVFGAPFADPGGVDAAGTVYVVEGQAFIINSITEVCQIGDSVAGRQLDGTEEGQMAGTSVDGTGDIDGDATNDFVVGSPGTDQPGDEDNGSVEMVLETVDLVNQPPPPPEGEAPIADAGVDQLLECQSGLQATTDLDGSGSFDADDDIVSYEWSDSGLVIATGVTATASFGLGSHLVTLSVTDATNLSDTDDVTITVEDTTAPVIGCPADVVVECTSNLTAPVTLDAATAADGCDNGAVITNDRTTGGADASDVYPLGITVVTFTATDDAGNASSCSTTVTVGDSMMPIVTVVPDPSELWPPNHRLENVHFTVAAFDQCDPEPVIVLESVVSNEADDGPGNSDGKTSGDIQDADAGTADFDISLRAERDGNGAGRIYTVTYTATDVSGNVGTGVTAVVVPHDQGIGVEPIELGVTEEVDGSQVSWGLVPGAATYNVIRGDLHSVMELGASYHLGDVACIEQDSTDASTRGSEDAAIPAPGKAFFYLVEYADDLNSSYGSESAGMPRVTGTGACQ